ncbi:hypothetical protein L1887_58660 [Cichorium endivia]|nr:hypothetical protein L1887_58660 [Cichorium endivia]
MTTTAQAKTRVKVVFGCMTFGAAGAEQARVHDLNDCRAIVDIFASHGHTELDTARMYGLGSSEDYLRQLGYTVPNSQGFEVATKVFPSARKANFPSKDKYTFSAADISRSIDDSLRTLGTSSFDLFYLHSPDRETPLEATLEAVNAAYVQGKFKRFGVSNYRADEVDQIIQIADKNGWVKPVVYQGLYNAITRTAEEALFPTLRKHGIAYYAYNPLGGGFFTGAFNPQSDVEKGSRFDPERAQGQMYRQRYWTEHYFNAIEAIRPVAEKHGLSTAEIALRWMMHHSALDPAHGDAVIIGASSTKHIEQNLIDLEKGPLPQDVLDAVDKAWNIVKPHAPAYHH